MHAQPFLFPIILIIQNTHPSHCADGNIDLPLSCSFRSLETARDMTEPRWLIQSSDIQRSAWDCLKCRLETWALGQTSRTRHWETLSSGRRWKRICLVFLAWCCFGLLLREKHVLTSVCVCVYLYLLHTDYQNSHSPAKVRIFMLSEDLFRSLQLQGLRLGSKVGVRTGIWLERECVRVYVCVFICLCVFARLRALVCDGQLSRFLDRCRWQVAAADHVWGQRFWTNARTHTNTRKYTQIHTHTDGPSFVVSH